jgi:3-oxoacyl-[acyl-carrier protein] reductase
VNLLEGKTAIVTGGALGIGKAIATAFAHNGADVAVCDIDLDAAKTTAAELEAMGRRAAAYAVDVRDCAAVAETVDKIVDTFSALHILVNNAGITRDGLIVRMTEADWEAVLAVNLKGCFNFIKAVTGPMMRQRAGTIISIASIVGMMGNPGQANYCASKAGVIGLTKSVAKELAGRNITANAIAPGFIATRMTDKLTEAQRDKMLAQIPLKRFGEPDDVAQAALFLAGPMAAYITGQVIVVDGGMLM